MACQVMRAQWLQLVARALTLILLPLLLLTALHSATTTARAVSSSSSSSSSTTSLHAEASTGDAKVDTALVPNGRRVSRSVGDARVSLERALSLLERRKEELEWKEALEAAAQDVAHMLGVEEEEGEREEVKRNGGGVEYGDYYSAGDGDYSEITNSLLDELYDEYTEEAADKVKEEIVDAYIDDVIHTLKEEEEDRAFKEKLAEYLEESYPEQQHGEWKGSEPAGEELEEAMSSSPEEDEFYRWLYEQYERQTAEKRSAAPSVDGDYQLQQYLDTPVSDELATGPAMSPPATDQQQLVDLDALEDSLDDVENAALLQTLGLMSAAQNSGFDVDTDPYSGLELRRLDVAYNVEKIKQLIDSTRRWYEGGAQYSAGAVPAHAQYGDYGLDTVEKRTGSSYNSDIDQEDLANTLYSIHDVLEKLPLNELETISSIVDDVVDERENAENYLSEGY